MSSSTLADDRRRVGEVVERDAAVLVDQDADHAAATGRWRSRRLEVEAAAAEGGRSTSRRASRWSAPLTADLLALVLSAVTASSPKQAARRLPRSRRAAECVAARAIRYGRRREHLAAAESPAGPAGRRTHRRRSGACRLRGAVPRQSRHAAAVRQARVQRHVDQFGTGSDRDVRMVAAAIADERAVLGDCLGCLAAVPERRSGAPPSDSATATSTSPPSRGALTDPPHASNREAEAIPRQRPRPSPGSRALAGRGTSTVAVTASALSRGCSPSCSPRCRRRTRFPPACDTLRS